MLRKDLLTAVALITASLSASLGYDVGDDITLCWHTDMTTMVRTREDCGTAYTSFTFNWPEILYSSTEYNVGFKAYIPNPELSTYDVNDVPYHIPHANIHSCVRSVGFCTPFVSNTPGLSTHSPTVFGNVSETTKIGEFSSAVELEPLQYTIIAHIRWYDTSGNKHDMARAVFKNFQEPPDPPPPVFDCPKGHVYAVEDNEAFCSPCPKGTFEEGGKLCTSCNSSTYNDKDGQNSCLACPANAQYLLASGQKTIPFIPTKGATKRSQCACVEGFYTPSGKESGSECLPCPEGAKCTGNGEDVRIIPLPIPGYFKATDDAEVMGICSSEESCPGGDTAVCGEGFEGHMCAECADGYFMSGGLCEVCEEANKGAAVLSFVLFLMISAAIYFAANVDRSSGKKRSTIAIGAASNNVLLFLQLFSLFVNIQVRWPETLRRFMVMMSFVNVDLSVLSLDCMFDVTFTTSWRYKATMPFFFTTAYILLALARYCYGYCRWGDSMGPAELNAFRQKVFSTSLNAMFVAWSLLHVSTSTVILSAFACVDQPDGSRTMQGYAVLSCDSPEYRQEILPVAVFSTISIAIGYPVLLAIGMCVTGGTHLATQGVSTPFKKKYYFWEVIDLVRKLLIASCLAFGNALTPGKQIALVTILMITALIAQVYCRPFKHINVNTLVSHLYSTLIIILVLAGMVFNEEYLEQTLGERDFMTTAAEYFIWFFVGLCFIFAISVVGYSFYTFYWSVRTNKVMQHEVEVPAELLKNTLTIVQRVDAEELIEHCKEAIDDEDTQRAFNQSICLLFALGVTSKEFLGKPEGMHFVSAIEVDGGSYAKDVHKLLTKFGQKGKVQHANALSSMAMVSIRNFGSRLSNAARLSTAGGRLSLASRVRTDPSWTGIPVDEGSEDDTSPVP
mmetsp:Transcript_12883/g.31299  ORF Transcript_12883/g.31299 Transcript_12883/m.31299 type:complete len:902 (+) Transcript_12883:88-2793(+)|eukprot:CAMPEP_0185543566 /NCGR_PEP_ID=MMETSP1381-20130426/3331_1 /TAXON_ID=298111 /ORGANISM="Pavlova sp., Strain CCMP459" /LENGTH=901 /DNA_ID=CAMNT_0028155669 /DNA_START=88 /DNA_END=2793 /DNA_ORIENTATION=-